MRVFLVQCRAYQAERRLLHEEHRMTMPTGHVCAAEKVVDFTAVLQNSHGLRLQRYRDRPSTYGYICEQLRQRSDSDVNSPKPWMVDQQRNTLTPTSGTLTGHRPVTRTRKAYR